MNDNQPNPRALTLLSEAAQAVQEELPDATVAMALIDRATQALAAATTPEEIKMVRDKADLLARFFRQRSECAEAANALLRLKLGAERQIGEYLRGAVRPGSHVRRLPPGISENQSRIFQRLAAIPADRLVLIVGRIISSGTPISTRAVLRAAETFPSHPKTGARASSASGSEEQRRGSHGSVVSLADWQARRDRGMEDDDVIALEPPIGVAVFREHFPNSMEREPDGIIYAVIVAGRGPDRSTSKQNDSSTATGRSSSSTKPRKRTKQEQPVAQPDAAANVLGRLGEDDA